MSTTLESTNGQLQSGVASTALEDAQWLKSLNFRASAPDEMNKAAAAGNVVAFASALVNEKGSKAGLKSLFKNLKRLREATQSIDETNGLATVLFDPKLENTERSVRIEAFIAENTDVRPESVMLTDAIWILALHRNDLEPEALLALWRWTLQRGQEWMESRPNCDPEQGLSQLRFLEVCYLLAVTFQELKGSRKLQKETLGLIHSCVDESVDDDGTPQPQWLPMLPDSLSCLGRIALFAQTINAKFWKRDFKKHVKGLLERTASLCSRNHISFSSSGDSPDHKRLDAIAAAFGLKEKNGLRRLIKSWQATNNSTAENKLSDWALPNEDHQSDWATLACLRSGWQSPVDQCVVLHDSKMPQIDVVVADHVLFQGAWGHELTVDGKQVECSADWTCTCWFADGEVDYLEIQQEIDATTKITRQVILLKEENQLILSHAVIAEGADQISYQSNLPFHGTWTSDEDSATREFALLSAEQRVRVYPLSLPQDRVTKADGDFNVTKEALTLKQEINGSRLYVSTVFDWSEKRKEKQVDWSRLTVAQDGQIEPHSQAAAFRYRIGRSQWMQYRSLEEPDIPRTVLGLHTSHETVLGRFTSKGKIEPIIEVEM